MRSFKRKHLISIEELSKEEIETILETAESFADISKRPIKKVPTLRGKTVINLFFEPSTRTRSSFEIAAKRLSADVMSFSASISSVQKGENLKDTVLNLEAMYTDIIVIRHAAAGAAKFLTTFCRSSVINAGDGSHEHPTQALLDAFTVLKNKGKLDGLKIAIVGDILHSRVARSDLFLFRKMGSHVVLCGPPTLVPPYFKEMGAEIDYNLESAIEDADVIIMLRLQLERMIGGFFPSIREYRILYSLTAEKLRKTRPDAIIMHPGPINRGIELTADVADSGRSVILEQVENGVAVRMAVLSLLAGGVA